MGKTAVIFPGQGAQSVGMGRDFVEASPRAATVFRTADELLGIELSRLCFEGPADQLERTDIQQPAIFVTSVAIWEAMLEKGIAESQFAATAGLSLGEYTALHVAGSIGFEYALKLVARRGQLMQEAALASASGMVSIIGSDEATVQRLCDQAAQDQVLVPANFNCPGQIVISGHKEACARAVGLAEQFSCRAVALQVAGAFHSPLMASAADGLWEALMEAPVARPHLRVVANVTAQDHQDAERIKELLCKQVTSPVRWAESMQRLIDDGFDRFVEVGPGRVLTGLMRKIDRKVKTINISEVGHLDAELLAALAG